MPASRPPITGKGTNRAISPRRSAPSNQNVAPTANEVTAMSAMTVSTESGRTTAAATDAAARPRIAALMSWMPAYTPGKPLRRAMTSPVAAEAVSPTPSPTGRATARSPAKISDITATPSTASTTARTRPVASVAGSCRGEKSSAS